MTEKCLIVALLLVLACLTGSEAKDKYFYYGTWIPIGKLTRENIRSYPVGFYTSYGRIRRYSFYRLCFQGKVDNDSFLAPNIWLL